MTAPLDPFRPTTPEQRRTRTKIAEGHRRALIAARALRLEIREAGQRGGEPGQVAAGAGGRARKGSAVTDDDKVPPHEIAAMFGKFLADAERDAEERRRLELAKSRERDAARLASLDVEPTPPAPSPLDALFAAGDVAESPIEHRMLRAIILRGVTRSAHGQERIAEIGSALLYAQLPIGQYRVDIALTDGIARLVVECDGRAYHSNEAQLLADRRRDRGLTLAGWRVIRFSGSEICKNADACAAEALEIFDVIRGVR